MNTQAVIEFIKNNYPIITGCVTGAVGVITALVKTIQMIKGNKLRLRTEDTAKVVEQCGHGLTGGEKLAMFTKLLKDNYNYSQHALIKAREYLEKEIIPLSKSLNVFKPSIPEPSDANEYNKDGIT